MLTIESRLWAYECSWYISFNFSVLNFSIKKMLGVSIVLSGWGKLRAVREGSVHQQQEWHSLWLGWSGRGQGEEHKAPLKMHLWTEFWNYGQEFENFTLSPIAPLCFPGLLHWTIKVHCLGQSNNYQMCWEKKRQTCISSSLCYTFTFTTLC